ncbi:hypothetical protein C8Q73DRAFT_675922 [Cubamyces lactineus]|nr:hypothetical protein C8Q73DRAFT_675922 [Cubamyces lactineus]
MTIRSITRVCRLEVVHRISSGRPVRRPQRPPSNHIDMPRRATRSRTLATNVYSLFPPPKLQAHTVDPNDAGSSGCVEPPRICAEDPRSTHPTSADRNNGDVDG